METVKRTYARPSQTLKRFKEETTHGKCRAIIAGLIEGWIRKREVLRHNIVEGCREMNAVYLMSLGSGREGTMNSGIVSKRDPHQFG